MSVRRIGCAVVAMAWAACSGGSPQTASTAAESSQGGEQRERHEQREREPGPGLGGRLFDHWAKELGADFKPDDPETPEPDGRGGPFGNGTLPASDGRPMLNTGHDYRLKNLFGWDLRGGDGIYGPRFKNKAHVLLPDLLKNTDSRETWIQRIEQGEDAIPAYGNVLTRPQIEALVDFLLAVRDGAFPRPDEVFALSEGSPGHYALAEGADAARGHAYIASACAQCHGAQGTDFLLENGAHSLGTIMRTSAYETWLKVLNGQPGSTMHAQVPASATPAELAQLLRDIHAASCDRARYPRGAASSDDVPDGDPRCGPYLK